MATNILEELEEAFPDCWFRAGVDFDGDAATIVWSGEGSQMPDGNRAFDYYDFSGLYQIGVHNDLDGFAQQRGFHWQCHDPGTYLLYKN